MGPPAALMDMVLTCSKQVYGSPRRRAGWFAARLALPALPLLVWCVFQKEAMVSPWSCYVLDSVRAGALLLGRQPMFPLAFSEGITYPSESGNCPCGVLQFG